MLLAQGSPWRSLSQGRCCGAAAPIPATPRQFSKAVAKLLDRKHEASGNAVRVDRNRMPRHGIAPRWQWRIAHQIKRLPIGCQICGETRHLGGIVPWNAWHARHQHIGACHGANQLLAESQLHIGGPRNHRARPRSGGNKPGMRLGSRRGCQHGSADQTCGKITKSWHLQFQTRSYRQNQLFPVPTEAPPCGGAPAKSEYSYRCQ